MSVKQVDREKTIKKLRSKKLKEKSMETEQVKDTVKYEERKEAYPYVLASLRNYLLC
jgi:ribosomal protein S19E (S16A)